MKELTIEQKAKAYDEVVNKLKGFMAQGVNPLITRDDVQDFFPELKESEDEKIRIGIIAYLKNLRGKHELLPDEWFAWLDKHGQTFTKKDVDDAYLKGVCDAKHELEKQCAQKSIKVPKFKVGDWIIDIQGVSANQIIGYEDDSYYIKTSCSKFYLPMKLAEKNYRLWTIQDAKAGDVLTYNDSKNNVWVCIFKKYANERVYDYCTLDRESFWERDNWNHLASFSYTPATKEQRDLLFQKMKESGYEWDAEKKELKKVEQKPIDDLTQQEAKAEIDEKYKIGKWFTGLIPCWVNAPSTQQPAHDFHGKNIIAIHLKDGGYRCCCIDDKKPVTFTLTEGTPLVEGWNNRESSAWSEEDEKMLNSIIEDFGDGKTSNMLQESWLKSLRPQTTWKPSDEQMKVLDVAIKSSHLTTAEYNGLVKLREQLKSL